MKKIIILTSILFSPFLMAENNPFKFKEVPKVKTDSIKKNGAFDHSQSALPMINSSNQTFNEKGILGLGPNDYFIANINGTRIYHNVEKDIYKEITKEEYDKKMKESGYVQ